MTKLLKIIEPLMLCLVPIVLLLCAFFQLPFTSLLILLTAGAAIVPFFLRFERQQPRPRDIMPIVVLSAIAAAGRIIFAPFPNFKPVSAIVIVSAICFGKQSGFLTGALAALASNMFLGQGPWTPLQMYAWGLVGYLAGMLNEHGWFQKPAAVYIYGFLSALAYGLILDSWYIVGFVSPITWQSALLGYGAGLPFSLSHAVATVVFLIPILKPWCRKIRRIIVKFGLHC
ncbi:DUF6580 family putative transport protein [Candidatus Soleaferrea massiliensis]|uniref:DUF6580 family putative transport protein n=1 Tax=Candidatus Soleaferrea massiliensis TaxID=1470354 RepID=UPI00058B252A|nr:DUF6580 family putative transport protein [Candidatus Soleaferrea massiliensis]